MNHREARLTTWSDERLRAMLEFFDSDLLRSYYSCFIRELRNEIERRQQAKS